jgi:hypothetical protein
MTVYVDDLEEWGTITGYHGEHAAQAARVGARHGHAWCHLFADLEDCEEIHAFARRLGLKREWFDRSHYDLVPTKRARAIALGAVPLSCEEAAAVWQKARTFRRLRNYLAFLSMRNA